jgi:signal transduction histidine kinase/DNA-binding response OmpR family regulator
MKVVTKLWIGFGILMALLTLGGLILIMQMLKLEKHLEQIAVLNEPANSAIYEMQLCIVRGGVDLNNYLDKPSAKHRESFRKSNSIFQKYQVQHARLAKTAKEKELSKRVAALNDERRALSEALMNKRDQQQAYITQVGNGIKKLNVIFDERLRLRMDRADPGASGKMETIAFMQGALSEMALGLDNFVSVPKDEYKKKIIGEIKDFRDRSGKLKRLGLKQDERRALDEADKQFEQLVGSMDKVFAVSDTIQDGYSKVRRNRVELEHHLTENVQAMAMQDLHSTQERAEENLKHVHHMILWMLVYAFLIAGSTALGLGAGLNRSLAKLLAGVDRMGGGDLSHRIDIKTRDEIGQLASAFNRMAEKRQQVEMELAKARDAAVESAQMKSRFLANMSHEIRTPMNGITGMTSLLLNTNLTTEQRELVETVCASGDTLLTIINDILDFSKIEAGKLALESVEFDFCKTVETTLELLAEKAQRKGLELGCWIDRDVPSMVASDPIRLRQIITNLASNGIKFTGSGEVMIRVTKGSETSTHTVIKCEVQDTGIGINEEEQRRLFQPFSQADSSTTRRYGGTGLGLAISKQLVTLMGGSMGLKSSPGKGSNFWFTIPLKKVPMTKKNSVQLPKLSKKKLLIVEDHESHQKVLLDYSSVFDLKTETAQTAAQALELVKNSKSNFDLVIVDVGLKDMDGVSIVKQIRELDPKARILATIPFTELFETEALRVAGANACITKPMRKSQLMDCMVALLKTEGDASMEFMVKAPEIAISKPVIRKGQGMKILLAEDNEVNQKVLLKQLAQLGYRADLVENGAQVLEAMNKKEYQVVFMDCQMPIQDGYEVTAQVRKKENGHKHTTIIAMTANALVGDREKCLEAGMDDYMSKPVKLKDLESMLNRWGIDLPANTNGNNAPEQEVVIDNSHLEKVFDDDGMTLQELMKIYLRDTLEVIENIKKSLEKNDSEEIERIAHKCGGASATLGLVRMVPLFNRLEKMAQKKDLGDAGSIVESLASELDKVEKAWSCRAEGKDVCLA